MRSSPERYPRLGIRNFLPLEETRIGVSNFAGPIVKTDHRPAVIAFVDITQELSTNDDAHTIGKPAVEDEFSEIDDIEFPPPRVRPIRRLRWGCSLAKASTVRVDNFYTCCRAIDRLLPIDLTDN